MIDTEGKTTRQVVVEIFEALVSQGRQCTLEGVCCYGDGEGNHCAVGWLMPEEISTSRELAKTVICEDLLIVIAGKLPKNEKTSSWYSFLKNNKHLLRMVQQVHDESHSAKRAALLLNTTHFADDPIDFTDWIAIQDSDIV